MISKKRAPTTKREVASFTVPSPCWQAVAQVEYATGADEEDAAPWCEKAQALHLAKKQATASFSRMSMQPGDARLQDSWTKDERNVLRARADLLHTLMTAEADPKICLEVTDSKPARVCVMYNRMRCEGDVELGPMQSTMSWVVHGAEQSYQQLVTMGEHAQASVLGRLLQETHRSMPANKEVLQALSRLLVRPAPDRLLQAGLGQGGGCTRVMRGELVSSKEHPEYEIAWGALDVNVQEAWQNPSTNAAIRLSVLEATHQATREASRTKLPLWSNTAYLQVRIRHNDESHNLMFTPFCDSEACTVSHVQFAQSVFDHSGPERGILNLGQNPDAIHAIPLGTVTPMRAYVCLKAHKANRLNEAQLNYVHSRGLLQHRGFDTRLLPPPEKLFTNCKAAMPPAKSTRVSGMGVDVMASSYHLADQVYTTITVVQYPPFGTQFFKAPASQGALCVARRSHRTIGVRPVIFNPGARSFEPKQKSNKQKGDKDDDDRDCLYPIPRSEFEILYDEDGHAIHKAWAWGDALEEGEFFFIDGLAGDPYEFDDRLILFETVHGLHYPQVQDKLQDIRDAMIEQKWSDWDKTLSFYENMNQNEKIQDFWIEKWHEYFKTSTEVATKNIHQDKVPNSFWYCKSPIVWAKVFLDLATENDVHLLNLDKYVEDKNTEHMQFDPESMFGQRVLYAMNEPKIWLEHFKEQGKLDPLFVYAALNGRMTGRTRNKNLLPGNKSTHKVLTATKTSEKIPLPITSRTISNKHDQKDTVKTLQSRICALESKLQKASNNKNTQALLERVLERLEEA